MLSVGCCPRLTCTYRQQECYYHVGPFQTQPNPLFTLFLFYIHSRLLLGAVMMAFFCFASRRGSTLAVTAFTISARTASTATSATSKSLSVFTHRPATAFRPRFPSLRRQQSTTAAAADSILTKLEQSLDVTHPAYEVIQKDVVTEYGAYCTLYKHKK